MSERPAIEIYSIGTELLNGQIQDTNSFWMAQQIAALGGYVRRIAILDDDMDELTGVLKDACQRGTRVVITTGGLGPTPDDMTVEAIAKIMGVGTEVDETLVKRYMESRGIEKRADVSEGLIKMATKPEGSVAHPNPAGVAPCVESQSQRDHDLQPTWPAARGRGAVPPVGRGCLGRDIRRCAALAAGRRQFTRIAVWPDPTQRNEPISQYLP